jgi:hypothetical protein
MSLMKLNLQREFEKGLEIYTCCDNHWSYNSHYSGKSLESANLLDSPYIWISLDSRSWQNNSTIDLLVQILRVLHDIIKA